MEMIGSKGKNFDNEGRACYCRLKHTAEKMRSTLKKCTLPINYDAETYFHAETVCSLPKK